MFSKLKNILFIHGAGEGAYQADKLLSNSLQKELGAGYSVHCPQMEDEDNAPYDIWKNQIDMILDGLSKSVILVGHSIGASHLLKYLTEQKILKSIDSVFFLAAPFWGGNGWHYEGFEEIQLPQDTAAKLPQNTPVFLYHCTDDEVVPVEHVNLYKELIPEAKVKILNSGGHQFNNDLGIVVKDIKSIGSKVE